MPCAALEPAAGLIFCCLSAAMMDSICCFSASVGARSFGISSLLLIVVVVGLIYDLPSCDLTTVF